MSGASRDRGGARSGHPESNGRTDLGWLVVFAKAPEVGRVKTRLCPPLTPAGAAEFYRAMLWDVLEASARAVRGTRWQLVLALHPPDACPGISRKCPAGTRVISQHGVDLGARMAHAARAARAAGADAAVLRGSDSPATPQSVLRDAVAKTRTADVALSPDPDGGYSLVALSRTALRRGFGAREHLFSHRMSHASVLAQTRLHAERAALVVKLLEPSFDVDRASDLDRLRALGAAGGRAAAQCSRTLAQLDQLDREANHPARTPLPS